jgi:hypothetical protein
MKGSSLLGRVLDSPKQGFFTPGKGSSLPEMRVLHSRIFTPGIFTPGFFTPGFLTPGIEGS